MKLSTAVLEKQNDNFDMLKHQMKLNRVKSYVADQQRYIHQYRSPNSSDMDSVPESYENQEPLSSNAFSASISEIIRRKQALADVSPSSSIHHPSHLPSFHNQKQPVLHSPSIDHYMQTPKRPAAVPDESVQESSPIRHNKRHKSSSSSPSSQASESIPLQTKPSVFKKGTHGMHLLQKFVSPNLQISRITLKSNTRRQSKLGIFRKGKSSAQGRAIPDITDFDEQSMIAASHKKDIKPTAVVMEELSHEPPSISKFFMKRPVQTLNSAAASSHLHHATRIHQAKKPKETLHTTPVLSSDHHQQATRKGPRSSAVADTPYEAVSNNNNNSFDSIYQLLDECQDKYHPYLPPTNNNGGHHHANNPSYSAVKTPHSFFQPTTTAADHTKSNTTTGNYHLPYLNNSKLPRPFCLSPLNRSAAIPRMEPSMFAQQPAHYYNRASTHTSHDDAPPPPVHHHHHHHQQQQPKMMRKPRLPFTLPNQRIPVPSWQVAESFTSVAANTAAEEYAQLQLQQQQEKAQDDDHTTTANDDLELVLQSQAMNMLGDSIRQNDDNIQGFWLRQPGFSNTTRGH